MDRSTTGERGRWPFAPSSTAVKGSLHAPGLVGADGQAGGAPALPVAEEAAGSGGPRADGVDASDRTGGVSLFSRVVTDYWLPTGETRYAGEIGSHQIVVDDSLPGDRSLMLLEPAGKSGILSATSATIDRLGLTGQTRIQTQALARALAAAHMKLNGADYLFYLPVEEQAVARSHRSTSVTRRLDEADTDAFAVLSAEAPEEDLDQSFVELDHWLTFGTFVDDRLGCVASMYPWRDTHLADLGVLTLPAYRGRGLAKATVRALSAAALELGYEPQYRCQVANAPSVALARSAGFERFGTWDVIDHCAD